MKLPYLIATVVVSTLLAVASSAQSFSDNFLPPYTTNWFAVGNGGIPPGGGGCSDHICFTYTTDGLQWGTDTSLTATELITNTVFNGDIDISFTYNHQNFGRTNVGLITTDATSAIALAALDTDDTNYLNFVVPNCSDSTCSTEYEHAGTPYMNRWTTIRIKVQGTSVMFYAGVDGSTPVLLDTLHLSAPLGSYRAYLDVHSAPWKSGGNTTTFDSVAANIAEGEISLSMHSVSASAMSNGQKGVGIDDPIVPIASETVLKEGQPVVTAGLVADGVTPLLIEITPTIAPLQATTFQFTNTTTGGSLVGGFINHLKVLQYSGSTGTFVAGTTVTLSPDHPIGFAYISGIKSEDLTVTSSDHELSANLTITQSDNPAHSEALTVKIRRPPMVLVHGITSSNDTWYKDGKPNDFLAQLLQSYPSDFVIPIEYGVNRSTTPPDTSKNTDEPLEALAPLVDTQVKALLEENSAFRAKWAFTRYDAAGHSQGGILLRMMCTQDDPSWDGGTFHPFRSDDNAQRGRFHRVVTFGSPHKGTNIVRYSRDLAHLGAPLQLYLLAAGYLQEKFDPWGDQLQKINYTNWHIDSGAKFNLLGTRIYDGKAPPLIPDSSTPPAYVLGSLCFPVPGYFGSPGSIVLPSGSDGVVDYWSQFGGESSTTPTSSIGEVNISHSSGYYDSVFSNLFAVSNIDTDDDTHSSVVASKIVSLLTGSVESGGQKLFGSFLATATSSVLKWEIDVLAAAVRIRQIISPLHLEKQASGAVTTSADYEFQLNPNVGEEPSGEPVWFAEVFGPEGITALGVSVVPQPNDPEQVTVSVDENVVGDVVLFVSYPTADGSLIVGTPVTVVSRPPGASMTGIELLPSSMSLSVGATPDLAVWGEYDKGTKSQLFILAAGAQLQFFGLERRRC